MNSSVRGLSIAFLLFACAPVLGQTTTTISNLPAATTPLSGAEALPCVQSGVTKKCLAASLGTGGSIPTAANPTATIGTAAVNGSAPTFMRSDAAPPLPATLPALDGSLLTNLNASNLGSGTVPDARFPATLPAISGVNLTSLNASNLGSGTVSTARGGLGADNSAASGVPLFAAGINTMTATTGTGNVVRATSPVLVTPNLGVPTAITLTAGTGLPISTGVSGLGTGVAAALAIAKDTSGGVCTVGGGGCAGGGSVSVTAATSNIVINPTPGTGTFTVGTTNTLREDTTTAVTIVSSDLTKLVSSNNASAVAVSVPQATGSFASGAAWNMFNYGAGIATLTPTTSTLAGKASEKLYTRQGASIFANGVGNYEWILGLPQVAADGLLINTTASTDYPIPTTLPSCSGASNALTYNTGTHALGCNTISGSGTVTTLTAGTNITFSSGATCTTTCTINATGGGGGSTYTATFTGNVSGTPSAAGLGLVLATATFTDNNTAGSGTAAFFPVHTIAIPTIAATNASVTTTYTPTLTIDGPPTCGTNETCTEKSALYLKAGNLDLGTAGQRLRMYNVGTPGATNSEFFRQYWNANVWTMENVATGTGANRDFQINATNTLILNGAVNAALAANGTNRFVVNQNFAFAPSNEFMNVNTNSSLTVPAFGPDVGTTGTGWGGTASILSNIISGTSIVQTASTGMAMKAGVFTLKGFTVSTLPASPAQGSMAFVTDANAACTFGGTPAGGGSTVCFVRHNGTAWIEG